jgi:signal transduction histidine kinase
LARIEAEDDDRSETEFLTDLSHELRTPLNAILGFASVLLDEIDGPLTASQREDVETILSSGKHLGALVDDVLDMAALHSGRVALAKSEVDASALVRDVVRLLEAQRRKKPIAIRAEVASDVASVIADEKRLRQIVMNLGTNALKFTESGEVVLSAARDGDGVRLTVRDTGPGIPPGERDSIFLEFTQISSGVMRRTQGSGLGLAIVKRLTELHGGRIWVESVTGEGSSFHVWLPRGGSA